MDFEIIGEVSDVEATTVGTGGSRAGTRERRKRRDE